MKEPKSGLFNTRINNDIRMFPREKIKLDVNNLIKFTSGFNQAFIRSSAIF